MPSFKIVSSAAFWFQVKLHMLDDSGKTQVVPIRMKFKRLPTDEVEEFQMSGYDPVAYADCITQANGDRDVAMILLAAKLANDGTTKKKSADRADELMRILTDWEGIIGEDDKPLAFDRDNLIDLLQSSKTAYADIREAYNQAVNGEAKRGN